MSLPNCSVGNLLNLECHKATFSKRIENHSIAEHDRELLTWRTECNLNFTDDDIICAHHEKSFLSDKFSINERNCCDPLFVHKKPITNGLCKISLDFAKLMKECNIHLVPGKKICPTCKIGLKNRLDNYETCAGKNVKEEVVTDDCEWADKSVLGLEINVSLGNIGLSPVKFHSKPINSLKAEVKTKLVDAKERLRDCSNTISDLFQVDHSYFGSHEAETSSEIIEKAACFDRFLAQLKDKIHNADSSSQIQLLTLVPQTWSHKKSSSFFEISEYKVHLAKNLFKSKGLLAIPETKKGKVLPLNTKNLVTGFYENDLYSRLMPGQKDYKSIGKNIHIQKRLLLCNLKELYVAFKNEHLDAKIGFSTFCSLRPRWCIIAGATGTHSVCVCTWHQNVKLMVDVLPSKVSYTHLMSLLVCAVDNRECMLGHCSNCPTSEGLHNFLTDMFQEVDHNDEIIFLQWQTTDRLNNWLNILFLLKSLLMCWWKSCNN